MKLTSLTVLGAFCSAAGLAGCGTVAPSGPTSADDVDHAKVNAINSVARRQGVQVHWINLPQKLNTSSASKPAGAG